MRNLSGMPLAYGKHRKIIPMGNIIKYEVTSLKHT